MMGYGVKYEFWIRLSALVPGLDSQSSASSEWFIAYNRLCHKKHKWVVPPNNVIFTSWLTTIWFKLCGGVQYIQTKILWKLEPLICSRFKVMIFWVFKNFNFSFLSLYFRSIFLKSSWYICPHGILICIYVYITPVQSLNQIDEGHPVKIILFGGMTYIHSKNFLFVNYLIIASL